MYTFCGFDTNCFAMSCVYHNTNDMIGHCLMPRRVRDNPFFSDLSMIINRSDSCSAENDEP